MYEKGLNYKQYDFNGIDSELEGSIGKIILTGLQQLFQSFLNYLNQIKHFLVKRIFNKPKLLKD